MRLSSIQVLVILLGLAATVPPIGAQSEEGKDCQRASKLHAEQDVIKELFFDHGERAHAEVSSGSPFPLEWTGSANSRDYVSIATPDQPAAKYVSFRYARRGSPAEMKAPEEPGTYELRYIQGQSRTILARRAIEVR